MSNRLSQTVDHGSSTPAQQSSLTRVEYQQLDLSAFGADWTLETTSSEPQQRIMFRIAQSREDFESAFGLVYQQYRRQGFIAGNDANLWLTIHNALPEATTFLAECHAGSDVSLTATVTLVPDSPIGLPMEDIYGQELESLRRAHRRIGEVTMLAFDGTTISGGLPLLQRRHLLLNLFKMVWNEARGRLALDDLCIAVHPLHARFYEQISFQSFGPVMEYGKMNGNPAMGMRNDLRTARARLAVDRGPLEAFFFKREPLIPLSRETFIMSPGDVEHLFEKQTEVFERSSWPIRRYLLDRYRRHPACLFAAC